MTEWMSQDEFEKKAQELSAPLTVLQRNFVHGLVGGMTQRQAYVAAGGKAKKPATQDNSASTMFRNVQVKAYYELLNRKAMEDSILSKTEAMKILSDTARAKMSDFMTYEYYEVTEEDEETGEVRKTGEMAVKYNTIDSKDLPPHIMTAVASVTMTKYGPKFTLKDSNVAVKQLSKMRGWDSPTKITTPEGEPLKVESNNNTKVESEEVVNALNNLLGKL